MTNHRAIILAAGRGSRMGSLTLNKPKCLTVCGGKPLLQWQFEALGKAGISEIAIVQGYRAEVLARMGAQNFLNRRWEQTRMVRSLECAETWLLAEPCIVCYSDILFHPANLHPLLECRADLAITTDSSWQQLWADRFGNPLVDSETFRCSPSGWLMEIGGKPKNLEQIEGQYMGLLKFTPEGWRGIRKYLNTLNDDEKDRMQMTDLLQRLVERGTSIATLKVAARWAEIASKEDLRLYQTRISLGKVWDHDWRWDSARDMDFASATKN